MVSLTIDDRTLDVPEGTLVIEAAAQAGIELPRYCYHPALSVSGNCRICLVEIERMPDCQISCSTPVQEGMVVRTTTARVRQARRGVLEFLLIHHPLDCQICDQAGECSLQDYYFDYSLQPSRFQETKRIYPPKDIGDELVREMNRCIHCRRCTKFLEEIVGDVEYGVFERGADLNISNYLEEPLTNQFQGNLADICPVGALVTKDFKFKRRVWYLTQIPSICTACATGCNVHLHVPDARDRSGAEVRLELMRQQHRIQRITPRENMVVNEWWICDAGRKSFEATYRAERRFEPAIKADGELEACRWQTALEEVSHRFRTIADESGENAIAVFGSPRLTNEENYLLIQLFRQAFPEARILLRSPESPLEPGRSEDLFISPQKVPNFLGASLLDFTVVERGALRTLQKEGVRALYLAGERFEECPEEARFDFVVIQDHFPATSLMAADVFLPGASPFEKEGTFVNRNGRIQRSRPAHPPPGQAREDRLILQDLARVMGGEISGGSAESVFESMVQNIDAFNGLSYQQIGSEGRTLEVYCDRKPSDTHWRCHAR